MTTEQLEALHKSSEESFKAAKELIQGEEDAIEAAERKRQKKKDKKERGAQRGNGSDDERDPRPPTVILLNYQPPPEKDEDDGDDKSSPEEDEDEPENVIRRLQYEGRADTSDTEKRSPSKSQKRSQPLEPVTPEELESKVHEPTDTSVDPYIEGAAQDVDAPEKIEEQFHAADGSAPAAEESSGPPRDGDKPERDGEDDPDKTNKSPKEPSEPPDPPEPDGDRDPDDDQEEGEEEEEEEEVEQEGEEEEKEAIL